MLNEMFPHKFPLILGWDVAGVVDAVGSGAQRFNVGDAVYFYARKPIVQWGAYAEYITMDEEFVAHKPKSLLFHEAGAVPLAALTAYQALFDEYKLEAKQTVLIHAAAGGVGHFAVQLAKIAGATVIATAGAENQDFLESLHADEIINYKEKDFVDVIRQKYPEGVDRVFDTMGGDIQNKSIGVLRPGGHMVSMLAVPEEKELAAVGATGRNHFVTPNAEQLKTLADLFDNRQLRVHISQMYSLDDAALAQQHSQHGHTRGKTVLVL